MKIQKVLVLVELENGHVHQVLADAEQKEICVNLMRSEDGALQLSKRLKPVTLEFYPYACHVASKRIKDQL
jgi:hypothetical protein